MEWWIKEEVEKYKDKKVLYGNKIFTVKEVFWKEVDEEFVYWIEGSNRQLQKVFERNIRLVS